MSICSRLNGHGLQYMDKVKIVAKKLRKDIDKQSRICHIISMDDGGKRGKGK